MRENEIFQGVLSVTPAFDENYIENYLRPSGKEIDYSAIEEAQKRWLVSFLTMEMIIRYGPLSSGLAVLAWIYHERNRSLHGVGVYGFSHFQDSTHHYFNDENPVGQFAHDGKREKRLFEMMRNGTL